MKGIFRRGRFLPGRVAPAFTSVCNVGMKISILGAGKLGGALARLWAGCAHELFLTSEEPEELHALMRELGVGARIGTNRDAAAWAEAVVLAVPWEVLDSVAAEVGEASAGKILVDATNAVVFDPSSGGFRHLAPEGTRTAEVNRARFPLARLVKAFNTVPAPALDALLKEEQGRFAVPLSGDDGAARATVGELIRDIGLDPLELGGLDRAGLQEFGAALWGETLPLESARAMLEE